MKELAIKQEKLINEDEIFEFLNLSNQRENLKREIMRNNKHYRSIIKKRPDSLSVEIDDVIASIQELDRRIEKLILEKRSDLILEAKRLSKGKTAVKGYGGHHLKAPRFVNKKG